MGVTVLIDCFRYGGVDASDYPKYIIPYTPICISIIICTTLLPFVYKYFVKYALLLLSALGITLFFMAEFGFEHIIVFDGMTKVDIEAWQLLSCSVTPQVMETIGNPLSLQYSPAFKLHFYIISLVIILTVINVIYGSFVITREKGSFCKIPLLVQSICVIVFIGLCVFACFTAFYRTGEILVSPISAVFMSAFFIVFGVTSGVYPGTLMYGKRRLFSIIIPSVSSIFATVIMYVGELVLMGGKLFIMGTGFPFEPLSFIPFAVIDLVIILISGLLTYFILNLIKPKHSNI